MKLTLTLTEADVREAIVYWLQENHAVTLYAEDLQPFYREGAIAGYEAEVKSGSCPDR